MIAGRISETSFHPGGGGVKKDSELACPESEPEAL